MKKFFIIILMTIALNSCLLGPKYSRPDMKAPKSWMEQNSYIDTKDTITNLKWFSLYKDSILNKLIDTALKYNFDLANAAMRIQQARMYYNNSKSDFLPSVGYSASADLNTNSDNAFNVLGTAAWEIDFWGKLRHANKAAYAMLLASEEGYKTVKTTLISDVANLYFLLCDLDNRLLIAQKSIESRTEYFKLIDARFKGGDAAELDMLQADQQLQIAKATFSSIKRERSFTERTLNIILGQVPQPIARGPENINQTEIPLIPSGLPSILLDQRPDVKYAEYQLQVEVQRIGIAQAMRFPNVNLTGFFGVASNDLTTLLSDASLLGNATATFMGPIFNFGKNKRRVDIQRTEAEIAANNYLKVYYSALGEVENSLVSIQEYGDEYQARKKQAESAAKALKLSKERYYHGYTGYMEVLIAESYWLDAELIASATRSQQLSSYVTLYRALGGGW